MNTTGCASSIWASVRLLTISTQTYEYNWLCIWASVRLLTISTQTWLSSWKGYRVVPYKTLNKIVSLIASIIWIGLFDMTAIWAGSFLLCSFERYWYVPVLQYTLNYLLLWPTFRSEDWLISVPLCPIKEFLRIMLQKTFFSSLNIRQGTVNLLPW